MTRLLENNERERYPAVLEALENSLPGRGLFRLRREAMERFASRGFPGPQEEGWRSTPLKAIRGVAFETEPPAGGAGVDLKSAAFCPLGSHRLTFVDGRFSPELSTPAPKGATLTSLAAAPAAELERWKTLLGEPKTDGPFALLNAALWADGALLHVPQFAVLERPVHLLFLMSASGARLMTHPRVLIVAEPGARLDVIEEYAGQPKGVSWTNAATEIVVGEGASVSHLNLQREPAGAVHLSALRARLGKNSVFKSDSYVLGASVARQDSEILLDAEGADCELNGLTLVSGSQHAEHRILVDHSKPHGTSRVLCKAILDDEARSVFNGLIKVRPMAQKTSATVTSKNLLLSSEALADAQPEFRIHANDVQCKHGATIGQLSADALFYLRSRGLSQEAARSLLVYAFASEMVTRLAFPELREKLSALLHGQLPEAS